MITPVTDHVARTRALFLEQFKGATHFQGLVAAMVGGSDLETTGLQEVENQLDTVGGAFALSTATGDQLDVIGDWFGVPRNSLGDAGFRFLIRTRIFELSASGNNDELQDILKALTSGTVSHYWPNYPAAVQLSTNAEAIPADLWKTMIEFVGAGINLWLFLLYDVLPLACAEDPTGSYLAINDDVDTVGLSDGDDLVLGTTEIGSNPWDGGGGVCDVDPGGTIIPSVNSGRVFDVVSGGG